ncbi:E3 ubiquitin-protein ligase HECW2, partial [Geodia barretti]
MSLSFSLSLTLSLSLSLYLDCTGEQTDIFFAIFQANNSCLARSSMLTVTNRNFSTSSQVLLAPQSTEPCTIRIEGIFCSNLRTKLFGKPDPFLKMGVVPGPRLLRAACHAQRVVTDPCFGSVHPQWIQSYEFGVVSTDVLEIDVRDKFVASRPSFTHFLGRARIPASQLLRRSSVTLTLPLQKRLPSDRVTGTLTFTVTQPTIMAEEREEREGGRRGGRRGGEDERREEGGEQREEAEQATSNETESSAVTESSIQNLPGPTATHEPPLSLAGAEQLELAGATPLTAAANDSLPLSRQLSHDPQTNSRLNQIRSQLCGRGLQRGSQSLYTRSPAHQRRLQFTV